MIEASDIYELEFGESKIYLDPLKIRRELLAATSGRCWEWAKAAKRLELDLKAVADHVGETPDAQRAEWSMRMADLEGKLADAAYEAFGLTRLDPDSGDGHSEMFALTMLYDFLGWLEKKDETPNG